MLIEGYCYLLYGGPEYIGSFARCPDQASHRIGEYCYARLGRPGFENCDAARAAGHSDMTRSNPYYAAHLDHDSDGVACEST